MAATVSCRLVRFLRGLSSFVVCASPARMSQRYAITGWRLAQEARNASHTSAEASSSQLFGAVCVQRLPLITPEKTELEQRYQELQEQLEIEHSVLSDDEVELKTLLQRKKNMSKDDDDESNAIATAEEDRKAFEEEQDEEWQKFNPASRQTEADECNDHKSLNRKLQETLVLLIKRQNESETWEIPLGEVERSSASLKEVAIRGLNNTCGTDLHVQFLGNIPIAVLKKYKKKVFFYKANYKDGSVKLQGDCCDYAWVSRNELKEFVDPEYYATLSRFLF